MTSMVVYCPAVDDRAEQEELQLLRERTREKAEARRAKAVEAENIARFKAVEAENEAMKQRAMRAAKAKRAKEARIRQRNMGYWIGAGVGVLALLAWTFTKDTGITALPLVLGGILMGRMK